MTPDDLRYLRTVANEGRGSAMTEALHKAADEIERLRKRVEELEAALSRLVAAYSVSHSQEQRADCWGQTRRALEAKE